MKFPAASRGLPVPLRALSCAFRPSFHSGPRTIPLLLVRSMSSDAKLVPGPKGVDFPPMENCLPLDKIRPPTFPDRKPVILVACGSFSPITFLHLRLFEMARDHLMLDQPQFDIIGGIVSPVHDSYGKSGLIESQHRLEMCKLATASSSWITVSSWEIERNRWSRTHEVLNAHSDYLTKVLKDKYSQPVGLKLLCGADILEACLDRGIWPPSDIHNIFHKYGVTCIERQGHNSTDLIHAHDVLYQYRFNIHLIPQHISNNISSTLVRRMLSRGLSIKYLTPDPVVDYIVQHKLYQPERAS